jgi:hypothetical protein
MKLGDHLQHGGRSRFRVSWRPILIDPPLPPSSSNTPAQRASNARARSSMLPGARRDLANVDRDSPPHPAELSHSRPTPAARPTTLRSRHRLACRQFLLRMRAGCGAERPAGGRVRQRDRCTPGRACPAGSVRRSTRRAPIRSGSGSAADLPATDGPQGRRHRNRPAIGGKVLGRSTVGVVACAPWRAVFGVAHVHRGSA